jgi:enterochelin esterase-like enzyme
MAGWRETTSRTLSGKLILCTAVFAIVLLWLAAPILVEGTTDHSPPSVRVDATSSGSVAPSWPVVPPSESIAGSAPSQQRVIETTFWSVSLNRYMPLLVYLPAGYNLTPGLPVLYMLHGLGGTERDWQQLGLFDVATRLINNQQIPPMIIVTPSGESGYWMDQYNNGPRFGSYVSKDLISYIDANFKTTPAGYGRAIGGMSMGAHGAIQLALNNPGQFSVVGAHSLVLRNKQQAFPFFGDNAYFERIDPVSMVAKYPERARGFRLWIDIGRSDSWYSSTNAFHLQLVQLGVPHSWNSWAGGHDSAYCSAHLTDYLMYYGTALREALTAAH